MNLLYNINIEKFWKREELVMKKIIISLFVFISLLSLVGCGSESNGVEEIEPTDSSLFQNFSIFILYNKFIQIKRIY